MAMAEQNDGTIETGFASHDGTYSVDFAAYHLRRGSGASTPQSSTTETTGTLSDDEDLPTALADWLIEKIKSYQEEHPYKFVGAGLTKQAVELSPQLPSRLWLELDIVPVVLRESTEHPHADRNRNGALSIDEIADKMARKCVT